MSRKDQRIVSDWSNKESQQLNAMHGVWLNPFVIKDIETDGDTWDLTGMAGLGVSNVWTGTSWF